MILEELERTQHLLLPCPFCGGNNMTHAVYISGGCIEFEDCGAIGPEVLPEDDIEKAEAAWNHRT